MTKFKKSQCLKNLIFTIKKPHDFFNMSPCTGLKSFCYMNWKFGFSDHHSNIKFIIQYLQFVHNKCVFVWNHLLIKSKIGLMITGTQNCLPFTQPTHIFTSYTKYYNLMNFIIHVDVFRHVQPGQKLC